MELLRTVTRRRFLTLGVRVAAPLGLLVVASPSVVWANPPALADPPTGISSLEEALRLGIARSNAAPPAEGTADQVEGSAPGQPVAELPTETPALEEPAEVLPAGEPASGDSLPVDEPRNGVDAEASLQRDENGASASESSERDSSLESEAEHATRREESEADSDDASEAEATGNSDNDSENDRANNSDEDGSDEIDADEDNSDEDNSDEIWDDSSGGQETEEDSSGESEVSDESDRSEVVPPEGDGYQHESAEEETESAQATAASVSGEVGDDWERAEESDSEDSDDFFDSVQWPFFGIITTYFMEVGPYSPRGHAGIDIAGPYGSPVVAMADGTVTSAGWAEGYGNTLVISHGSGYSSRYAHLAEMDVGHGDRVDGGDVIGYVGMTGYSTGPHLHLEVREDGALIDPLAVLP